MKRRSSQMRSTITVLLAYFWAYVFPIWIAVSALITIKWNDRIFLSVFILNFFILGAYHHLGAIFEFRIAHCMLQILHRQNPNPMDKSWSKTEKIRLIISGILFTTIGLVLLAMPIIDIILAK